jgi:hypothetical protein
MQFTAAWNVSDAEYEASKKARLRLVKKSEARQRALMARRESKEVLQPTNTHNSSSKRHWKALRENKIASLAKGSPRYTNTKLSGKNGSTFRKHVLNVSSPALLSSISSSPAPSKASRRKSWTKSLVVEKMEEMQRRRTQRRLSSQMEMEAKKSEMAEYGEWGLFGKILRETREKMARVSKPEDFKGHNAILGDSPITVCVRKRPLNSGEAAQSSLDVVTRSKVQNKKNQPKTLHILLFNFY